MFQPHWQKSLESARQYGSWIFLPFEIPTAFQGADKHCLIPQTLPEVYLE